MKEFDFTVTDDLGIHVRPAGQLAQLVKEQKSTVTISMDGKDADATKLFAVMGLAVKCGDTIHITVDGEDEEETASAVEKLLQEKLTKQD